MHSPLLYAYRRQVKTPFGLLGNDERALTFALGYTMQQSPRLLRAVLHKAHIKGLRLKTLATAQLRLEHHHTDGISDVEITIPRRLHLIIEAKGDLAMPTQDQIQRYAGRLLGLGNVPTKRLLLLTNLDNTQTTKALDPELRGLVTGIQWGEISRLRHRLLIGHSESLEQQWLRWFFDFLEEEYKMHSYTHQIWIVPCNDDPLWEGGLSFYDTHFERLIYYREPGKDSYTDRRPLYIALRVGGKVSTIQRVVGMQYDVPPVQLIPELESIQPGKGEDIAWPRRAHTIWHLSKPTPLPNPIRTGDPSMRSRHVVCDFDILLSSNSVKEIQEKMKERHGVAD